VATEKGVAIVAGPAAPLLALLIDFVEAEGDLGGPQIVDQYRLEEGFARVHPWTSY